MQEASFPSNAMKNKLTHDIIQWDVKSWSKALRYWEETVDWSKVSTALELGGREGGLSLWLAKKGIQVVCSDLSDVEKTAGPLHRRYHVDKLITYRNIDATNIPYENHFDVIVFKSIIGGIGRNNNLEIQKTVFNQIHKALKPGGQLLFAENLTASPVHQLFRRKFIKWANDWRYVSVDELKMFLAAYSSFEIKTTGVLATFGRSESQRKILSLADDLLLNKVCARGWRYIGYGRAVN